MFRRLLDLIKNPSHEQVEEKPAESSEIRVSREIESLRDVLSRANDNEALVVGRTVDNNIAISIPGYALITMFMLSFRHGPSICVLVNSMGYYVDKILTQPPRNPVEQAARMVFSIFEEQKHGVPSPFPFVRADGFVKDELETRYNAIMEPQQFVELASSINELNESRPDFGSEALNKFVDSIVEWVNYGMNECITPVDVMSSLGGSMEGKA